jgi:hypothetical protein
MTTETATFLLRFHRLFHKQGRAPVTPREHNQLFPGGAMQERVGEDASAPCVVDHGLARPWSLS